MARILITGGAGFLGTNLAARLLRDGHWVHVLDNFSTGRVRNMQHLAIHKRFSYTQDNLIFGLKEQHRNYDERDGNIPPGITQIYNLACPASPKAYSALPIETIQACTQGMKAVLDFAVLSGAKVLQTSTSEVYGDALQHPQREVYWGNVNPVGPRSCYDEGKRIAETLCYEYQKIGVQVRIARLFNTYGPFMQPDDGRVMSNFICQGLKGKDITVYGDGSQTRSLCYVDDTVEGLIRLMNSPVDSPVNIGNPHEVTMLELAQMIRGMTGNHARIVRRPLPGDDPKRRCPDISRATLGLDWEPKVSLQTGISLTIEYFKGVLHEDSTGPGTERSADVPAGSVA